MLARVNQPAEMTRSGVPMSVRLSQVRLPAVQFNAWRDVRFSVPMKLIFWRRRPNRVFWGASVAVRFSDLHGRLPAGREQHLRLQPGLCHYEIEEVLAGSNEGLEFM